MMHLKCLSSLGIFLFVFYYRYTHVPVSLTARAHLRQLWLNQSVIWPPAVFSNLLFVLFNRLCTVRICRKHENCGITSWQKGTLSTPTCGSSTTIWRGQYRNDASVLHAPLLIMWAADNKSRSTQLCHKLSFCPVITFDEVLLLKCFVCGLMSLVIQVTIILKSYLFSGRMEMLHIVGKLFTERCSAHRIIQSMCVKFFSRLRGLRVSAAAFSKLFWPDTD